MAPIDSEHRFAEQEQEQEQEREQKLTNHVTMGHGYWLCAQDLAVARPRRIEFHFLGESLEENLWRSAIPDTRALRATRQTGLPRESRPNLLVGISNDLYRRVTAA